MSAFRNATSIPVRPAGVAAPTHQSDEVGEATHADALPDEMTAAEGRRAAAAVLQAKAKPPVPRAGISALLDACGQVVRAAMDTRIIDEASALKLADALDRSQDAFEIRLVHMQLERVCATALLPTRARQRLNSSINAAFGRTGERFSATRSPAIDSLGLPRGDNGFPDVLIATLREGK